MLFEDYLRVWGCDAWIIWIIMTGTRVHMTKRHWQVSSDIGANPVSDIFLVHWILIGLILCGTWEILIDGFQVWFCAKCKLRLLSSVVQGVIFRLSRVFKVKVAKKCVGGRSGVELVGCHLIFALGSSKADSWLCKMVFSWPLGLVLGWSNVGRIAPSFAFIFFALD